MNHEPACINQVGATLGEGPVWAYDALWFVDIKQRKVFRLEPESGALRYWDAPAQVGWVLPAEDGAFVAGLQTGLHRFDPEDGSFTLIAVVEPQHPGNRLNDACTDPQGRLWFGSMDDGEEAPTGAIYRADAAGIAKVTDGICITNGPTVSPDGTILYYNDTLGRTLHAARIEPDGTIAEPRLFAQLSADEGYPDGPVVDSEGCVWVGLWGGWSVRRYDPAGGLMATVRLPVANVTKIAFGGAGLATAFATTASKGLSDEERAAQPLAGSVFAFDPGVAGQAVVPVRAFGTTLA